MAETAGTGTDIPQNHECGGFMVPAFADIGASGLLAYRVKRKLLHQSPRFEIFWASRRLNLDPRRKSIHRRKRYQIPLKKAMLEIHMFLTATPVIPECLYRESILFKETIPVSQIRTFGNDKTLRSKNQNLV